MTTTVAMIVVVCIICVMCLIMGYMFGYEAGRKYERWRKWR